MRVSRSRRRESNDDRGFTLVEILIVIVVLSVLAAIVALSIGTMEGDSARASCAFDVQTVDHAVVAYRVQMQTYPPSIGALETSQIDPDGNSVGPWLHNTPINPRHYEITLADGSTAYTGWSTTPASNAPTGTIVLESWDGSTKTWSTAPEGYVYAPPAPPTSTTINSDGPFTTPAQACAAIGY